MGKAAAPMQKKIGHLLKDTSYAQEIGFLPGISEAVGIRGDQRQYIFISASSTHFVRHLTDTLKKEFNAEIIVGSFSLITSGE